MSRKNAAAVQKTHQNSINFSHLTVVEGELKTYLTVITINEIPFSVVYNVFRFSPSPDLLCVSFAAEKKDV